jgi:hypothetical protein
MNFIEDDNYQKDFMVGLLAALFTRNKPFAGPASVVSVCAMTRLETHTAQSFIVTHGLAYPRDYIERTWGPVYQVLQDLFAISEFYLNDLDSMNPTAFWEVRLTDLANLKRFDYPFDQLPPQVNQSTYYAGVHYSRIVLANYIEAAKKEKAALIEKGVVAGKTGEGENGWEERMRLARLTSVLNFFTAKEF